MKKIDIILNSYSLSDASVRLFGKGRTNSKYHEKVRKLLKANGYTESIFQGKSKKSKYIEIEKSCPVCRTKFFTKNNKKEKKTCSHQCANSLKSKLTDEIKSKISKSLKDKIGISSKLCKRCNNEFQPRRRKTIFCSVKCSNRSRRNPNNLYSNYRLDATFTFGLSDYPDKFNFALIENFGWYSPTNSKKPNLNGVSRDHIYSVMDGFENNIDPIILSHPANCRLMRHNDNVSKNRKSDITIDQLLEKIKKWDNPIQ